MRRSDLGVCRYVRTKLAKQMQLRQVPEIRFYHDDAAESGEEVPLRPPPLQPGSPFLLLSLFIEQCSEIAVRGVLFTVIQVVSVQLCLRQGIEVLSFRMSTSSRPKRFSLLVSVAGCNSRVGTINLLRLE